jgi:hypothetical protein
MALLGIGLANAEAQGELTVQPGVCQIQLAASVQPIHQLFIVFISPAMTEADQVQRRWRR